ncbi:FkbM family methyltransferase [Magnetovibrio sp.]|uniref:FkbM family methyltransferase n=1 Tax=Magnetovibrio sp. TaxID=2024836 RepID=UPI002F921F1A
MQARQHFFDVGSHHGHLSAIASRLVGPKGQVCAFEANKVTLEMTRQVIRDYACPNVYLVHAAIFDEAGLTVPLYAEGHGGDSIIFERSGEIIDTPKTLTLDKFCATFDLVPDVLKFDVEGVEKNAIRGAKEILKKHPPIIVEMSSDDNELLGVLDDIGYDRIIDLNNYHEVKDGAGFDDMGHAIIRNVLCLNTGKIPSHLAYAHSPVRELVAKSETTELTLQPDGRWVTSYLRHPAGRYVATLKTKTNMELPSLNLIYQITAGDKILTTFNGPISVITNHYRDLPFHLYEDADIRIELVPNGGEIANPERFLNEIIIERINGMVDQERPMLL